MVIGDYTDDAVVALLAEGVDRNSTRTRTQSASSRVALLAEGVDRNYKAVSKAGDTYVALLAEGVDRNKLSLIMNMIDNLSPSSRRAWIEIPRPARRSRMDSTSPSSRRAWIEIGTLNFRTSFWSVALLAEGVDRNTFCPPLFLLLRLSPSSRRAWIEID